MKGVIIDIDTLKSKKKHRCGCIEGVSARWTTLNHCGGHAFPPSEAVPYKELLDEIVRLRKVIEDLKTK
jgi:hypothetical protein